VPRRKKTADFTEAEFVTVGGIKLPGPDYQTIKEAVRTLETNADTGMPMSLSAYLSRYLQSVAADIRAGKRMKKY